jgi:hypothetical protein
MCRITIIACLAFAAVTAAHAEDSRTLRLDPASKSSRTRLVTAAEDVCQAARLHDAFGDFGTQEECVENTLQTVQTRQAAGTGGTQVSSAK